MESTVIPRYYRSAADTEK